MVSSNPRPHFTPRKDPVQEAGWAPGPVWKGGKSRPHRDSTPERPPHSQSLYRLSHPARTHTHTHTYTHTHIYIYTHIHMEVGEGIGNVRPLNLPCVWVRFSNELPVPNVRVLRLEYGRPYPIRLVTQFP